MQIMQPKLFTYWDGISEITNPRVLLYRLEIESEKVHFLIVKH
jgi:hypothetical protein